MPLLIDEVVEPWSISNPSYHLYYYKPRLLRYSNLIHLMGSFSLPWSIIVCLCFLNRAHMANESFLTADVENLLEHWVKDNI